MQLLSPKNDIVFQRLFGQIGNEKITTRLLSLIMEKEIEEITLDVSNRIQRNRLTEKLGLLDVRAKLKTGEDINIEMQLKDSKEMPERMLYYWSRLYGRKLQKGQSYAKLKPTISILITDFFLEKTKQIEQYHTIWNLRERNYQTKVITNDIELHIIELPKIKEESIKQDMLAVWMLFLKNPKNERVKKRMEEDVILKQAMEELKDLSGREDFQRIVELREKAIRDELSEKEEARKEGLEEGLEEGIKKGIKKGKEEAIEEVVRRMLKKGLSIQEISHWTGISEKDIKSKQETLTEDDK